MISSTSKDPKELVQPAVQANKDHQYALKVYTERLEAELEHIDKLLVSAAPLLRVLSLMYLAWKS